jgi:hypothetical protein
MLSQLGACATIDRGLGVAAHADSSCVFLLLMQMLLQQMGDKAAMVNEKMLEAAANLDLVSYASAVIVLTVAVFNRGTYLVSC